MTETIQPLYPLQNLLWPDYGLSTERALYAHLDGAVALSIHGQNLRFGPGGWASFATYGNMFNLGQWNLHCGIEDLSLALWGEGDFELTVTQTHPTRSWDCLQCEPITLQKDGPTTVSLDIAKDDLDGVVYFELRSLGNGELHRAEWQSSAAPKRTPKLMLAITTFRREEAVKRSAARFAEYIEGHELRDHLHLTVVDNGQTVDLPEHSHITLIPNENLGGSGGFARGLLAAKDRDATHCLFMDDDAAVQMDALLRTWRFLAYAEDPKTAVAGAVFNAQHRWQLWENGAIFDRICHPQHGGMDLRDTRQAVHLLHDSTPKRPDNFYGGWWYFAFPIDETVHMPFPFFVRGDDVSFSLVHDFNIVTLNGVASFQDEDFSVKETPQTVYLDLRSHMAHHLSLPSMEIGRNGLAWIMVRFYMRALLAHHYDTLSAIHLAQKDVMAGPEYFRENADMSVRRKEIGALTVAEKWQAQSKTKDLRPKPRWALNPHRRLTRALMKMTLNGHLLPGFSTFGNRIHLSAGERGARRPIWGASSITYTSLDGEKFYTVEHNKRRAWQETRKILGAIWAFRRDYTTLRTQWRNGYDDLTKEAYWRDTLHCETPDKP